MFVELNILFLSYIFVYIEELSLKYEENEKLNF